LEEDSDHESDGYCSKRKKQPNCNLSLEFEQHGRNEHDYSYDDSRDDSSSNDHRYQGLDVEVKAEKAQEDSPKVETKRRQERRKRQVERENERHNQERQGLKGHYISVNHMGIPYGFGVGAWRVELNKLCQGLDLSVTNI